MILGKKKAVIYYTTLFVLFLVFLIFLTAKYAPEIVNFIKNPERFERFLSSQGSRGIFLFIFFEIIQVVIAVIPGELVQIPGGYVYGTFWGTIYSTVGILIGSMIAFYLSRLFGYNLVKVLVPKKELERFDFLINSPKYELIMFVLFLIPGVPKDILVFVAGATPVKPIRFFILYTIARFPSLLVASFIGANIQEKDYRHVIILSIVICILLIIGYLYKDTILKKLHHSNHKH